MAFTIPPARVSRVLAPVARAALEVGFVAVLFLLYRAGRSLVTGQESVALQHARAVHALEQWLPLPSEAWLQSLMPSSLLHAANVYYVSVHFPLMVAFLIWGYTRRPRAEYVWARNLLIALTGAALVIHIVFPLAPPRMFPQWGFVDSMAVYGPNAYAGASGASANQFAAMPSLHIGWALLIAYVVMRTASRKLAALAIAHAVVTIVVVVVTANHYWLDGIVAAGLLTCAALLMPPPERQREREAHRVREAARC